LWSVSVPFAINWEAIRTNSWPVAIFDVCCFPGIALMMNNGQVSGVECQVWPLLPINDVVDGGLAILGPI